MKRENANNATLNRNNIPEGWKKVKLGEVAKIKGGKRLPKEKSLVESPTKHPYIRTRDIHNNKVAVNKLLFVPDDVFPDILRYIVEKDDIIISIVGTIGLCAIIPNELHLASLTENCAKLVDVNNKIVHKNFLFYYLISEYGQEEINIRNVGSTQPKLPLYNIKVIPIPLPPLSEQKAIALVLSSLDDKIDLLHRQNKTLEAVAETLFRQWFIEEAKEDWEEKPLDEIADYLNGLACQKFPFENDVDRLPVLKIKELRNGFTENSDWVTSKVLEQYIVKNGDVIFSWSGSLLVKIWNGKNCVLNQHLFKVTSEKYPKWFYYFWTKRYLQKFISIAESKATTMGHIKRDDLHVVMVLVPSKEETEEMGIIMGPIVEKLIKNTKQICTLEQLRDTLLPKLMSGEVRVEV